MRAFIAAEIPENIREQFKELLRRGKKLRIPGAQWVCAKNMHITLKFLGEITPEQRALTEKIMARCARETGPLTLKINGTGTFPPKGRPRVLFASLEENIRLKKLAERIENRLAFLPLKNDHGFKPHLTLCRFKDGSAAENRINAIAAVRAKFTINKIGLFLSILTPRGPQHSRLFETSL